MPLVLLGHLKSSNVMKAVWALDELGLAYERKDIGNVWGGLNTPEYRAMNPTGLVPTLLDGDFAIWESNAVIRYICNAHAPGSQLYPSDPVQRGRIDQWLDCQQTQMARPQAVVFLTLIRTPQDKRDPVALAAAIKDAGKVWGWADAELARREFLCGEHLTLADIAWGVHAHRWLNMDFDRPDLPNLSAWYLRLLRHESFRTKWAGPIG
ncbi:MAG: glutathione S-transferase family protein [Mesorhizobium sp.]|uniref:glutathione S-transferase family protein n=1 Tax=Mesorhizobium sp. TaxID=1871066 RepID=UPI001ACF3B46|nr:glutathione S-transferase family protein [Mesorhizobium sp.]MBN9217278.1 glutathione S-transferase family protein [Mesorhizobium sp.]